MAGASRVAEWQQSITEIRDSEDHPDDPPLIAQLYVSCSELFRDIITGLSDDASADNSVLISLQRSQSYMVLWADGYGVSDGLLDKALDKSRRARSTTLRLIYSVSQTLTKRLILHVTQEHRNILITKIAAIGLTADKIKFIIEHDDNEDSDSDTSSETSSQAGINDLGEIADDLLTDTQCLMDLGSRFQEDHVGPINVEFAVSAAQLGTWEPSMNFVDRVRWRYPRCETALADRLGKANWDRVLRHREVVSENSRSELTVATPETSIPAKQAPSQVASTTFRDSALGSSATEYAETMVSYRAGQGDSIRVPPLPDGAREGKPFSCIGCGLTVNVKTKSAWKKHLFLDLQPYICLYDGCDFNRTPFPTKTQWECHVNLEHGQSQSTATPSECPICQENASDWQTNTNVHLARHLEEIALTVLPTNLDSEDGTDLDSGLASSETSTTDSVASIGQEDSTHPDALDLSTAGTIVGEVLGPKIWTGSHFLPRFIRQCEVPGEGPCYFYDDGTRCKTVIDGEPVNAHWGVTKAGKPRKRLEIACLTCRVRKIKCDPDYPRCVQCERFGRTCLVKNPPQGDAQAAPVGSDQVHPGTSASATGAGWESPADGQDGNPDLSDSTALPAINSLQAAAATATVATDAGASYTRGKNIQYEQSAYHTSSEMNSSGKDFERHIQTRHDDSKNLHPQPMPSLSSIFGPPSQIRPLHSPVSERPSPIYSPFARPHSLPANPDEPLFHEWIDDLEYYTKKNRHDEDVKEKGKIDRTMTDIYSDELYSPTFSIERATAESRSQTAMPPSNDLFAQRLQAANHQHLIAPTSSPSLSPFRHGSHLAPVLKDFAQSQQDNPEFDIAPVELDLEPGNFPSPTDELAHADRYSQFVQKLTNDSSGIANNHSQIPNNIDRQNGPVLPSLKSQLQYAKPRPVEINQIHLAGSRDTPKPAISDLHDRVPAFPYTVPNSADPANIDTSYGKTVPSNTDMSRPWKCPIPTCRYHEFGWPTKKEMDRHINDRHSATPFMYECLYKPCPYKSKRESNRKQHMAKAHGWKPDP
ncbi:elongation factor 1-beta [Apiospora arundinis]